MKEEKKKWHEGKWRARSSRSASQKARLRCDEEPEALKPKKCACEESALSNPNRLIATPDIEAHSRIAAI